MQPVDVNNTTDKIPKMKSHVTFYRPPIVAGISGSCVARTCRLQYCRCSCFLPGLLLASTTPPRHPLWFCQSKCTSLAAKSSGHRPSGCSREMPIVLASTGPSQTAQEGTDGTNGRAESNRGTGTEPHRSAVQITVV